MIDARLPHAGLRASRDTKRRSWFSCLLVVLGLIAGEATPARAQSSQLAGNVRDQTGQVVPGALVTVTNNRTGVPRVTHTGDFGHYAISNLEPGLYTVRVDVSGFQTAIRRDVNIDVGQTFGLDVALKIDQVQSDPVEVPGRPVPLGGSITTLIDRQFVENLPMNGRSLQTLLGLVPGMNMTLSTSQMPGQFSVNGQRTTTNVFMVDGVSANFGTTANNGVAQAFAGTQPALTASGGTNGLVSLDAVEQVRVHTSSYAPEFGRSPGGQIQIVTRSGTNRTSGSVAEYFRNDVLDANDWFANAAHLPKAELNQHDVSSVLGGPIHRDVLFYFLSYEGLWLQQPRSVVGQVPSLAMRQTAAASLRPTIEAFPLPTGADLTNPADGTPTGLASYTATSSDRVRFNAFSVRLDYQAPAVSMFGRFKQSPSKTTTHVATGNTLDESSADLRTFTAGMNAKLGRVLNEFRVNYSQQHSVQRYRIDALAGAVVPAATDLFPSIAFPDSDLVNVHIDPFGGTAFLSSGLVGDNEQRQAQLIDAITMMRGNHSVKIGGDYRYLESTRAPGALGVTEWFDAMTDVQSGRVSLLSNSLQAPTKPHVRNLSLFVQDTWWASPRFTFTYGLRWDVNPPPGAPPGEETFVAKESGTPATYTVAPRGTAMYPIRYTNLAPRLSVVYSLQQADGWATMLSGGSGLFFDTGNDAALRAYSQGYPFIATNSGTSLPFPSVTGVARPQLPITFTPPYNGSFTSYTDDFTTPLTRQWNVAVEQQVCTGSEISVAYVGAHGEHLLRQEQRSQPTPDFGASLYFIRSDGTSDYNALQIQFTRRMRKGLQVHAAYVWSHSMDTVSDALTNVALRGPSDFDIRHTFSAAFTYALPRRRARLLDLILGDWVLSGIGRWRSAPPVNLSASSTLRIDGVTLDARPDLLPNIPLYVSSSFPGGRVLNGTIDPSRPACVGPFCSPAAGTQGNLGRNAMRGFPASQIDLSVRRALSLTSNIRVSVAIEAFNLLNHPNFGPPIASITSAQFGQPTAMLSRGLGGLSPIYQLGGPRSLQLSARLEF